MTVSIDAGVLGLLLHPSAKIPNDPATGKPIEQARERIEQLIDDLDEAKERIIVSTIALSEFLVVAAEDGPQYLSDLALLAHVRVEPFDQLAAIELAALELLARQSGKKRHPLPDGRPWQKVKVDRQIVALARRHQCKAIYSDDGDLRSLAEDQGIKAIATWELDLPPSQTPLIDDSGPPLNV